jgi:hypothetical protein
LQRITRKREVGERRQLPIFSTVAFSANALQSPYTVQIRLKDECDAHRANAVRLPNAMQSLG